MVNINFVPDDYVQNNESRRANLLCFVLFTLVMTALVGSFFIIKIRQRTFSAKEKLVNEKIAKTQEAINQFEHLQLKRKEMMKAALTTAELIEPIPRSVLLASLTNNLPQGVSLLKLSLLQKQPKQTKVAVTTNKYEAAQADKEELLEKISPEKLLETHIEIEGMAPSDLQVASYMEQLNTSTLFDNVALVESKEHKIQDTTFRQFKLTAMQKKDIHLTKDDINKIRTLAETSVYNF